MKVTLKKLEEQRKKDNEEEIGKEVMGEFADELDVAKFLASVHSRIKDEIKEDFVLATLDTKSKEYIVEMTSNAYFSKMMFKPLRTKLMLQRLKWGQKLGEDHAFIQTLDKHIILVDKEENILFDNFMNKLYMLVIVNRNDQKNFILKVLSGFNQPEVPEQEDAMIKPNVRQALQNMFANQERKVE